MIVATPEHLVNIFLPSLTGKSSQKITAILGNILLLSGLIPYGTQSVAAQTTLACDGVVLDLLNLSNSAVISYTDQPNGQVDAHVNELISSKVNLLADPTSEANQPLRLVAAGIEDLEGNRVSRLGAIALDLRELYIQQGLTAETADTTSLQTIVQWAGLPPETSSAQVAAAIKQNLSAKNEDVNTQELIKAIPDSTLLSILAGFGQFSLTALGLPNNEIELLSQTVFIGHGTTVGTNKR